MALGQLLQPMFDTVDAAHGPFGGGDGRSRLAADAGRCDRQADGRARRLGLAAPVFDAMLHAQEQTT